MIPTGVRKITVIEGDGIGPEIVEATLRVVEASGVEVEWDRQLIGHAALAATGELLPQATVDSIRSNGLALKGPTETPSGTGHRSLNVLLRETFGLYANIRPTRSIAGVKTRFSDVPIDIVVFRENLEDLYIGREEKNAWGAEAISSITHTGSRRIAQSAFEYAREHGRKKVTIVVKPNILKLTHGLFLEVAQVVAKGFPEVKCEMMIADACLAELVQRPEQFDVILTTNFLGDLITDLCAGLVGGLGLAPGLNVGSDCAVAEAVHGTAPNIAGQGIANPTALILSATLLLDHMGEGEWEAADRIRNAVYAVLKEGVLVTGDLRKPGVSTDTYAEAVIRHLAALVPQAG